MKVNKTTLWVLSFCAAMTIIVPAIMDLNSTHMTNPLWAPHARFHWSLQYFGTTAFNIIALFLLWGNYKEKGSRLSIITASLAPLLFWGAFFPSLLMPGISTWPDGMTPFAPIAPNVPMAAVISLLCLYALRKDARARAASVDGFVCVKEIPG